MKLLNFLLLLLCFFSLDSFAGVNLKNGNYYITYTDIVVPGAGQDLKIERTYNSRSIRKGWFGYGWGSDYETFLNVSADGSIIVHENGSGARTRFVPNVKVDTEKAVKRIIQAMMKNRGSVLSAHTIATLTKKLKNDSEIRQTYARKYNVTVKLASGVELSSHARGKQKVTKTDDGYMRKFRDGRVDYFNNQGKLTKIKYHGSYHVDFFYDKTNGNLKSIKDSMAKQLHFKWYEGKKLVRSIGAGTGRKASYKYSNEGNNIYSEDTAKNIFRYKYDSNHNMIQVAYKDKTKMDIIYTPTTQFVKSVTKRSGNRIEYKYESNPKNPDLHYWTLVTRVSSKGKKLTDRYEYEIRKKEDGENYTYKTLSIVNKIETSTTYTECCGLPKQIVKGKLITNFDYNKTGQLVSKKSSNGDFVNIGYYKKFDKIKKIEDHNGWTKFAYDKKGLNLEKAINSDGVSVYLKYDSRKRISRVIVQDKKDKEKGPKKLKFVYNGQNKPAEIKMEGVGKINVSYNDYGEISKIKSSKKGVGLALEITAAFRSLIAIVKPAGVNLNI